MASTKSELENLQNRQLLIRLVQLLELLLEKTPPVSPAPPPHHKP